MGLPSAEGVTPTAMFGRLRQSPSTAGLDDRDGARRRPRPERPVHDDERGVTPAAGGALHERQMCGMPAVISAGGRGR
jgi:hypothetical protein